MNQPTKLEKTKELTAEEKEVLQSKFGDQGVLWRSPRESFDPSTRLPDDPDMFKVVTECLREADHPLADKWMMVLTGYGSQLRASKDFPPEGQIAALNRFWRNWINDNIVGFDTFAMRRALVNKYASYTDWINCFKNVVVPRLPRDLIKNGQEQKSSGSNVSETAQ